MLRMCGSDTSLFSVVHAHWLLPQTALYVLFGLGLSVYQNGVSSPEPPDLLSRT
jgi:hypothetical protein